MQLFYSNHNAPRSHFFAFMLTALLLGFACCSAPVNAQTQAQAQVSTSSSKVLPKRFIAAARAAGIPLDAFAVRILSTDSNPLSPNHIDLAWQSQRLMTPASLMKLPLTLAAFELLGPDFSWETPVFTDGPISNGVLHGSLYIRGSGDPKLWLEQTWLLLRQLRRFGITHIAGDVVLDQSAFASVENTSPYDFDGRGLRPYNVLPRALVLSFGSFVLSFRPDKKARLAHVTMEPRLDNMAMQSTIPLSKGPCGDWHNTLSMQLSPQKIRFNGSFPAACKNTQWLVAHPDSDVFSAGLLGSLWAEAGGEIQGNIRVAPVPSSAKLLFKYTSPPLLDILRDINKASNNLMARQVFLSLGLQGKQSSSLPLSQARFNTWWSHAFPDIPVPSIDNGSGLSFDSKITAQALLRVLNRAWNSSFMPEFYSSLPILGLDGTLQSYKVCDGCAHLKSGSFTHSGVYGLAGYVHGQSGQNHLMVIMCNHPKAIRARPAFEELIAWLALS